MKPRRRGMSDRVREGKRVALVLGSGGARGYAHIGVIEELEARGYRVVAIAGCSMGALVGGIYAAGQLGAYRDWVCRLDHFDILKLVDVTWSPMGAMRASKVMEKLESLVGDVRIEELPIPVTTVATDHTSRWRVRSVATVVTGIGSSRCGSRAARCWRRSAPPSRCRG